MNDSATCLDPIRSRRPDPVPSRVACHHPLTNYERMRAELAHEQEPHTSSPRHRLVFALAPETRNGGPRIPHPGDVAYWVACLGGACLLLLCATHG